MQELIRYSEENQNVEALKGIWGYNGQIDYAITVIKSVVIVNLHKGCKVHTKLQEVYDGFLQTSANRIIPITNSNLNAELAIDETAFGILKLKRNL